jgi:hypothetical protein
VIDFSSDDDLIVTEAAGFCFAGISKRLEPPFGRGRGRLPKTSRALRLFPEGESEQNDPGRDRHVGQVEDSSS